VNRRVFIARAVVAIELGALLALGGWAVTREFERFRCNTYTIRDQVFIVCSRPANAEAAR
jgi:hypothetical protein